MFNKKNATGQKGIDTLIGPGSVFEGNLETEGMIRVEGRIKGNLKVNGDVYVGNDATITGNILANDVHVSGTVEGNINSKGMLKLLSTAKLYGDIDVHTFVVDEGSLFQGKCSMAGAGAQTGISTENPSTKKSGSSRDYRKSSVLADVSEEKEKETELKEA